MKDDPDILVMGSSNGLGKTSILEACSLLYLATIPEENYFNRRRYPRVTVDLPDLLIRSGAEEASIEGTFVTTDNVNIPGSLTLYRSGRMEADSKSRELLHDEESGSEFRPPAVNTSSNEEAIANLFLALLGINSDPLLLPPFMYFHSYRKIPEGRLAFGQLVAGAPVSTFKFEIIRALMSREELFEDLDVVEAKEVLETLDKLMKQYAQAKMKKECRHDRDETLRLWPAGFRCSPPGSPPTPGDRWNPGGDRYAH
jgi:hypothetical protein